MTIRTPIKFVNDGTSASPNWNIQQINSTENTAFINQTAYLYGTNPSVTLSVSAVNLGSGAIGTMTDTRKTAGASSTSTTAFPTEGVTAEPGSVSVSYSTMFESYDGTAALPADTSNKRFPVYIDSTNNIRAMSQADFIDTFAKPAIDKLVGSGDQPGTYRIHTSTSLTDHSNVSTTPVFKDTRANTSLYTAAGIPESLDQPQDIVNYYLMKTNAGSASTYPKLVYIDSTNNLREYTNTAFNNLLLSTIRYVAVNTANYKLRYGINATGTTKGSSMTDTRLDGAGNYQQRFVNINDYRAQEFPNGTPQTINTYNLKIYKAP